MSASSGVAKILDTKAAATGVVVLLVGGLTIYLVKKYWPDLQEWANRRFNPTSDKNFAYSATNDVGAALTGDPAWSLGGQLYDWFSKPTYDNYKYSTSERRWTQVIRQSDGAIFDVDPAGNRTPAK